MMIDQELNSPDNTDTRGDSHIKETGYSAEILKRSCKRHRYQDPVLCVIGLKFSFTPKCTRQQL